MTPRASSLACMAGFYEYHSNFSCTGLFGGLKSLWRAEAHTTCGQHTLSAFGNVIDQRNTFLVDFLRQLILIIFLVT